MKKDFLKSALVASAVVSIFASGCAKMDDHETASSTAADSQTESDQTVDSYIVVLKKNPQLSLQTTAQNRAFVQSSMAKLEHRFQLQSASQIFSAALHGGVYRLSGEQARQLKQDANVAYVEKDQVISINSTQANAIWGLDRIDQSALPLNQTYNFEKTGASVNAYVIDTGILTSHQEFQGRAV